LTGGLPCCLPEDRRGYCSFQSYSCRILAVAGAAAAAVAVAAAVVVVVCAAVAAWSSAVAAARLCTGFLLLLLRAGRFRHGTSLLHRGGHCGLPPPLLLMVLGHHRGAALLLSLFGLLSRGLVPRQRVVGSL
jgi:hypothetical protein